MINMSMSIVKNIDLEMILQAFRINMPENPLIKLTFKVDWKPVYCKPYLLF
jgi:hypothetical protein